MVWLLCHGELILKKRSTTEAMLKEVFLCRVNRVSM